MIFWFGYITLFYSLILIFSCRFCFSFIFCSFKYSVYSFPVIFSMNLLTNSI